jgi:transcriptional regulator with XRE-family HTH domain
MRTLAAAVSDILRGMVAKQRVSRIELAQRTGFHRLKVNRLLNGKTVLSIDDADMLSCALGVNLDEIIHEAMAETPDRPRKLPTAEERLRSSI